MDATLSRSAHDVTASIAAAQLWLEVFGIALYETELDPRSRRLHLVAEVDSDLHAVVSTWAACSTPGGVLRATATALADTPHAALAHRAVAALESREALVRIRDATDRAAMILQALRADFCAEVGRIAAEVVGDGAR